MKKLILLAPVFALGMAFAQRPAPTITELKTYMNLTDTQITSIQASNTSVMASAKALMEQLRTKRSALRTLLQASSPDTAAIGAAQVEIQNLEKQIAEYQTKALSAAVSFLTADQKAKLAALDAAVQLREEIGEAQRLNLLARPAGGPGFGGPGGPGGGMMRGGR